ncbi:hypothetical protein [Henriciella sp.]|uniref:hypothetical protein n=1 Tax=Henriciella sp. TaxID=1968823 RepID=UPI00262724CE|nr:hypothetical protein [Henriciella sp.]
MVQWRAGGYADWMAKHVRVDRRSYRERISQFLNDDKTDGPNILHLFGHGGSGKTVLTEIIDAKPGDRKDRSWLNLALGFDASKRADAGDADFETFIGKEIQAQFRWAACLHKLRLQVNRVDRPGKPERSKAMPAFADFYDHCVSSDDTDQRRARRLGLPAILIILVALLFGTLSVLPDLLEDAAGLSLSRNVRIAFLVATILLPLLSLPQVKGWFWQIFIGRARYRRLGMRPTDFHDASMDQMAAGHPLISDEQLTEVFLSDLNRWLSKKRRYKGVLFLFDLHQFTDAPKARQALWKGLRLLASGKTPGAKSGLRDRTRIFVASKFRPQEETGGHGAAKNGRGLRSLSVTNLEPAEALQLVTTAISGLAGAPDHGKFPEDSLLGEVARQARPGKAENKSGLPGHERVPAYAISDRRDAGTRLARDVMAMIAFGTAPDAPINPQSGAIEVRDRLAAFLADPVAYTLPQSDALNRVRSLLDGRRRKFLEDAFESRQAYQTACLLAAFEQGLSTSEWDLAGEALLPFEAALERRSLFESVTGPWDEEVRLIVRPDIRALISAGNEHYLVGNTWDILAREFGACCNALGLDRGALTVRPGPEVLNTARVALSCLRAAACQEAWHQRHEFPEIHERAPALLDWVRTARPSMEVGHERLDWQVFEQAVGVCLQLAAPTHAARGYGLLGHARMRAAVLDMLETYFSLAVETDETGAIGFPTVPERIRSIAKAAAGRLEGFGELAGLEGEPAQKLDNVLNLLRLLNEGGSRDDQLLAEMRAAYAQRKLRTPQQMIDDFDRFRTIAIDDLSADATVDYANTLRKIASSLASREANSTDPHDEAKRLAIFNRFIGSTLSRLDDIKARTVDAAYLWKLTWFQLRACLYWTSDLLRTGPQNFMPIPSTLPDHLQKLGRDLASIDGMPDLSDLLEMRAGATRLERESRLTALSADLLDRSRQVYKKGLESRLSQARQLVGGLNGKTTDPRPAFTALASLQAQTFVSEDDAIFRSDPDLRRLRADARRLYAEAVIDNWRNHPMAGDAEKDVSLEEAIERFAAGDEAGANREAGYTDPGYVQRLLAILAGLNPGWESARPGSIVIARLESLGGEEGSGTHARTRLSVPNSDLDISIADALLPPDLYLDVRLRNGEAHPGKRRTQLYESWIGKLFPVILLANRESTIWPVTARGVQYASTILQLFCPIAESWEVLQAHQREGANARPLAWTGASNSWLTVRTEQAWIDAVLANGGAFSRQLPMLTCVTRHTYFPGAGDTLLPESDSREEEIRRFLRAAYRDLSYSRDDGGQLVFHHRNYASDRPNRHGPDPFSHQKNRTFISMFRKIFDEEASIYGWTDPQRQDGAASAFTETEPPAAPQGFAAEMDDDTAEYEVE